METLENQIRDTEEDLVRNVKTLKSKSKFVEYVQDNQEAQADHAGYMQRSAQLKSLLSSSDTHISHLMALKVSLRARTHTHKHHTHTHTSFPLSVCLCLSFCLSLSLSDVISVCMIAGNLLGKISGNFCAGWRSQVRDGKRRKARARRHAQHVYLLSLFSFHTPFPSHQLLGNGTEQNIQIYSYILISFLFYIASCSLFIISITRTSI